MLIYSKLHSKSFDYLYKLFVEIRRCSFLHRRALYQFICPILTKFLNIFQNNQKSFKLTVNYLFINYLFIKPPRKQLANKDSKTFYSFRYSALWNLFLVVEINIARSLLLNESQSNLPSASSSSVLSSEEGNNQLCLDSLPHLYQYYFRHIRIKEPPSPENA